MDVRFELRGGGAVELFASGFSHPAAGGRRFTTYPELIHVTLGARGLRIAAEHGSYWLARAALREPGAAAALLAALRERVAALPDAATRLARHEALERRQAEPARPRLGLALALVCVGLYALGIFRPFLVLDGEYYRGGLALLHEPWRLVTAQLLHANVPHLALNALGLFVLGGLLERQLGLVRSALVLGAAAAGAMLGCVVARYDEVLGASGLVSGVVGALLALELRRPELLPGLLRLSRRLLVFAVVAEFVLLSFVPNVAHAAHLGGILAGAVCALGTAPADVRSFEAGPRLRAAAGLVLGLTLAALAAFGYGQLDPSQGAARRGARLLQSKAAPALQLNNEAWVIATSENPTPEELALALRLARRAVRATGRLEPNLLDTLAEVYFRLGRREQALATIDQALALAPGVLYFEEQRRRFIGERDPEDRPAPPEPDAEPRAQPLDPDPEPEEPHFDSDGPGLRV